VVNVYPWPEEGRVRRCAGYGRYVLSCDYGDDSDSRRAISTTMIHSNSSMRAVVARSVILS
jgi:hypothetical protein